MPACIVKTCKSTSSKPKKPSDEKCHLFRIPAGMIDVWKKALNRENDDKIQYGQFVCHKHFLPEEVLWTSELYHDGMLIGQVSISLRMQWLPLNKS